MIDDKIKNITSLLYIDKSRNRVPRIVDKADRLLHLKETIFYPVYKTRINDIFSV